MCYNFLYAIYEVSLGHSELTKQGPWQHGDTKHSVVEGYIYTSMDGETNAF